MSIEYKGKKYHTTPSKLKETILKYGVAVIPNVLDEKEIENMNCGVWDMLETITKPFPIPIIKSDINTWKSYYQLLPNHSMLLQHYQVGQAQYVWDIRQNPKIVDIFCDLWNVDRYNLLTSFDGISFHMPPEILQNQRYYKNDWFHTDQSYTRPQFECVQSWVTGYDVGEGDGTLAILEGSNNFHDEFRVNFNITQKTDWYKLTEDEKQFYNDRGCKRISIKCPAGGMVFWDSRTIHSGQEPVKGRINHRFRNIVYVCMTPKEWCLEKNIEKKQFAFENMRMTNHYPHKPKLFPVNPHTYGAPLPITNKLQTPNLTTLGKSLAGFKVEPEDYGKIFYV